MISRFVHARIQPRAKARLVLFRLGLAALAAGTLAAPGPAQAQSQTAAAQFPPGSRLGLAPPAGMSPAQAVRGFEDARNKAFIRLIELPQAAFAEIEKTMSASLLKKQGMILDRRSALPLPGGQGILLSVRQDTPGGTIRKWLLVAPVPDATAMVTFELPVASKAYPEAAIRAALASLTTRDAIPAEEQLSLVPFRLGDLAGFRIVGVVPGRALQLTDGPKDVAGPIDQPHLIAGLIPGQMPRPNEREAVARGALGGLPPLKELRITGSEAMRIGGQQGHEIRATGKDAGTGVDIEIVQWLRFGGGAHLQLIGFAPKDGWTAAFMRFRTVRDSITPR